MGEAKLKPGERAYIHSALFGAAVDEAHPIGDVGLVPLDWEWWASLEKSDIHREQSDAADMRERLGLPVTAAPPPCLLTVEEEIDDWHEHAAKVHPVIVALRLVGARHFLDPKWTVTAAQKRPWVERRAGPYRLSAYGSLHKPPDHIDPTIASKAKEIAALVIERGAGQLLLPVRALAAPGLSGSARVLIAMQLIEGVYGRMDQRKSGLGFDERLIAAGVDVADVAWLVGTSDGRAARNAAVHGRDVGSVEADRIVGVAASALVAMLRVEVDPDEGRGPVERFRAVAWG